MALPAYRHLLRSARVAFQGDARLFDAARQQARMAFESNRHLPSAELSASLAHAEEVARILRHNIVQGQQIANEEQKYKLRIHEDIERGDNESIKSTGTLGKGSTGCCSLPP